MERSAQSHPPTLPATQRMPNASSHPSSPREETQRSDQPTISSRVNYGLVTLIGAGELMAASSRLHRDALSRVEGSVHAVFLDTTAGFESNADAITAKAVEYYAHRLQTELHVASYRHSGRATLAETARAVAEIRAANFIFAGPGSPTYALKHWRGSPVWEAVVEAWRRGAHLLFASAACITLGRYALPVYEIFKAGFDPYWEEGLNLFGELGLNVAIVPHFNDTSGGENYDSRFCYMGAARFDALQAQLPPEVAIIGIDEYTAITFEPAHRQATVFGQGAVTVIADGAKSVYTAGNVVSFDNFHSSQRVVVPTYEEGLMKSGYAYAEPTIGEASTGERRFDALTEYVTSLSSLDASERLELSARIEAARKAAIPSDETEKATLIDLVIELRSALRAAKRWDLADRARDILVGLGFEVQDTAEGTIWRRK